jgi:hypothetical protein
LVFFWQFDGKRPTARSRGLQTFRHSFGCSGTRKALFIEQKIETQIKTRLKSMVGLTTPYQVNNKNGHETNKYMNDIPEAAGRMFTVSLEPRSIGSASDSPSVTAVDSQKWHENATAQTRISFACCCRNSFLYIIN